MRFCALLLSAAVIFGMVAAFTTFNTVYLLALVCASCAVGIAGYKTRNEP
jgi:hypothetical protein